MKGQLAQRPFGSVLSELYRERVNGILTVNRDKYTKAIFVENGSPVFAISNAPEDQLGAILVNEGRLTVEQLGKFTSTNNAPQLAQEIAESGLIAINILNDALQKLITNTILSIFSWKNGQYSFEKKDRARLTSNVKLQQSAPHIILTGVRKIIDESAFSSLFSNINQMLKPVRGINELINDAPLEPMEGYVISRINEPMTIRDAILSLGLSEEQAFRSLYVLCMAGFIELNGGLEQSARPTSRNTGSHQAVPIIQRPVEQTAKPVQQQSIQEEFNEAKFQQEVTRLLSFFATADLYEVLGVTRRASEADIKKSYYKLAKKYHPDRLHKSSSVDLKGDLEKTFAQITEAYEKLSDPEQRKRYDNQIRGKPERSLPPQRPTPPPPPPSQQPQATPPPAPQPIQQPPAQPTPRPIQQSPAPQPPAQQSQAQRPIQQPQAQPIQQPPAQPASRPVTAQPKTQPAAQPAMPRPVAQSPVPTARPAQPITPTTSGSFKTQKAESGAADRVSASAAGPEPKPDKNDKPVDLAGINYTQGKQAFDSRDFARAAYLLREAVSMSPDNKIYRALLVQVLIKNQKWHKEAEDHLNELVKLEPFNIYYHVMLGMIFKEGGMQTRAVSKFKEILTMEPLNRIARRELREMGELGGKAKKNATGGNVESGIVGKFKALPPNIQYAIIGGAVLLIIILLYYQL
jgi:tetratricopeptide (TPR) repeat protein